jgi:hypothetical protein
MVVSYLKTGGDKLSKDCLLVWSLGPEVRKVHCYATHYVIDSLSCEQHILL